MPLQRPEEYFSQQQPIIEEEAQVVEKKRLKPPSSLFPKPQTQEPVVENIAEEIVVEKVVEKTPVSVNFDLSPLADMRDGIMTSIINVSNELRGKADSGSLIRIKEDLETYNDSIKKTIDSLDIRYYDERIDGIYGTLGELADVIDSNLENLSKLTGRDIKELRDEFAVMFSELQESLKVAAQKSLEDLQEVYKLQEEIKEAVADIPNQESRFNPQPILDNVEALKQSLLVNISESNQALNEKVDNLDIRHYEEDLASIQKFAEEVKESIKYYDTDVETLTKSIASAEKKLKETVNNKVKTLQKTIKESAASVRADFPVVPEVKYYDEEVELINEQLGTIRKSISELPEVKYYDKDVKKLAESIKSVDKKVSSIEIPDWSGAIESIKEEITSIKEVNQVLTEASNDPILPQNMSEFMTMDDFQKHYRTFLERVQIQLSTLGGGGAVNINDMDDLDERIKTNPQAYDGQVLGIQYDSYTKKAKYVPLSSAPAGGDVAATSLRVSGVSTFNGPIGSDLIPSQDVTYDIGTPALRWRDLYLSGNSIDLGGRLITSTNQGLAVDGDDILLQGNLDVGIVTATAFFGDGSGLTNLPASSGATGATGAPGSPGSPGAQGPVGATGALGATGVGSIGATGVAGPTGATGPLGATGVGSIGATGVSGSTGATGVAGTPGVAGSTGAQGPQGSPGGFGSTGATGVSGPAGPLGPQGATGVTGATGAGSVGATGAEGPQGATGVEGATGVSVTGATGAEGPQGATGVQGPIGATGAGTTGATGAQGPQGATGVEGSQGATGVTGLTGATGVEGPQGATGVIGLTGSTGATGVEGPQGATGVEGPQGATGVSVTGATGPQGATGVIGSTGATGPAGGGFFSVWGERGSAPTNNQYFALGNGDSANNGVVITEDCVLRAVSFTTESTPALTTTLQVEVYVNGTGSGLVVTGVSGQKINTSSGTPDIPIAAGDRITLRCVRAAVGGNVGGVVATATFITSGAIGPRGATGPAGPSGGATGSTGVVGPRGATGVQGNIGPIGATGVRGPLGATGPLGPIGATGVQGNQGNPGPTGTAVKSRVADLTALFASSNGQTPPGLSAAGDGTIVTDDGSGTADVIYAWNGGTTGTSSDWVEIGAIQGPQGATGVSGAEGATGPAYTTLYAKAFMTNANTINGGALDAFTNYNVLDPASGGNYNQTGFTIATNGITVPQDGLYQITSNCFMQSTTQRASVQTRFSVNGVDQPEIAAMGYIRNSNNHQDTTVTLTTIIELSASDVINVKFARGAQTGTVNLQGPNSSLMLLKVA